MTVDPPHASPVASISSVTIGLPRIAEEKDSPKDDHSGDSQPSSLDAHKIREPSPSKNGDGKEKGILNSSAENGANLSSNIAIKGKDKSQPSNKPDEKEKTKPVATKLFTAASSSSDSSLQKSTPSKNMSAVPTTSTKDSSKKSKESAMSWLKSTKSEKKSP